MPSQRSNADEGPPEASPKANANGSPAPPLFHVLSRLDTLEEKLDALRTARDPDRLLDADEVADLLGVSRRTVSTLTAAGDLHPIRVRGCVRYSRQAVEAYIHQAAKEGRRR